MLKPSFAQPPGIVEPFKVRLSSFSLRARWSIADAGITMLRQEGKNKNHEGSCGALRLDRLSGGE